VVSGSDAGLRHEPTKAGRLSIRWQQGLVKSPLLANAAYMLSVVREVNARLEWLKGKSGEPGRRGPNTELGIGKIETSSRHAC
jgi:hypothetical protein